MDIIPPFMFAGIFWFYRIKTEAYTIALKQPFCFHLSIGFKPINLNKCKIGVITERYTIYTFYVTFCSEKPKKSELRVGS
jgi:hypothetical protein